MLINIVIVGLIGLIAYWWANQGFLSGLLHLVCVITAGAMALAWWEPITVDYLLSKSWWSGLMPGAAMLLTFIVTLVILRLAADKLAFANTRLPRPIDMVGGGVLGAASGVLTVGLLMLGVGFIDQPQAILGYTGWTRNQEGLVAAPEQRLWLPVDAWVVRFYETLSVGVLHPDLGGRPLADWNPYLDRQASLMRDRKSNKDNTSFAQMVQPPDSVDIADPLTAVLPDGQQKVMMVPMHFEAAGMDFGNRLALSSSQLRLIGGSRGQTEVIHPSFWGQLVKKSVEGISEKQKVPGFFEFESDVAYITEPDERKADIRLLFLIPDDFEARFLQVRGTRFNLKTPVDEPDWGQFCIRANIPVETEGRVDPWGGDISPLVAMRGRLPRGSRPSQGDLKGDVTIDEEYGRIVRANAVRYPSKSRGRGKLGVKGYAVLIQDPSITEKQKLIPDPDRGIVKIAVGPTTNANILAVSRYIGGDGDIVLYDTDGSQYAPRGFELKDTNTTTLTFDMPIRRWSDLSHRPRFSSQDTFALIFVLPVGVSLDRLELGDEVVGLFENVVVEPPSTR